MSKLNNMLTALDDSRNIMYAIMQEHYFNLPSVLEVKFLPMRQLKGDDNDLVRVIRHGRWVLVYQNNTIYYEANQ